MDLATAAAELGLPCFPCNAQKQPVVARGFKTASQQIDAIRRSFAIPGAALIGVPTGAASGIIVIDVDVHDQRNGRDWLNEKAGELPQTRTHRTQSGGLHLLFRCPDGIEIRNSQSRIAPGIDVRGEGGYVIFPPSPGYAVADPTEPAEMPSWLITACDRPEPKAAPEYEPRPLRTDGGTPYGLKALEAECDAIRVASFGRQEATLNSASLKIGRLVAGGEIEPGLALSDLLASARSIASEPGKPAWSQAEIENKVRRAFKDGQRQPRQAPPRPEPLRRERPRKTRSNPNLDADPGAAQEPPDTQRNNSRPLIQFIPENLPQVVDQAEQALMSSGTMIFQRGAMLVRPGRVLISVPNRGEVEALRILEVQPHALVEELTKVAVWEKHDARARGFVPTSAPMQVAETLRQRTGQWNLPVLAGVLNAPTLRDDGSILAEAGYDQRSGLLLDLRGATFPEVLEYPTHDDADQALQVLKDLIGGFPFVGGADQAVALSAILTAVVRRSLRTAPLHAFSAPTAGSGKSLLVDIASAIATGREAGVIAQGATEEEMEKRLGAQLLAGDQIIAIDNCDEPLGGQILCQMLTQRAVRVRVLGRSEAPEMPSNALVCATGNNLVLMGDMTRRSLLCRIDPKEERPELREFDAKPVEMVRADRGKYVHAALTILRAYHVAGRPQQAKPLGSFEDWSRLVRDALIWVGEADPADTIAEARASDPKLEELLEVLRHWRAHVGEDREVTVRTVIEKATATETGPFGVQNFRHPDFREALLRVAGKGGAINGRSLGKWLSGNKGRVVDGVSIKAGKMLDGSATWIVATRPGW